MKKHIIVSIIIVTALFNINGIGSGRHHVFVMEVTQSGDTDKYLHDYVIAHKADFINKDLNYLLSKIDVKVKSYFPIREHKPAGATQGLIFNFENSVVAGRKIHQLKRIPSLTIYFESEVPS